MAIQNSTFSVELSEVPSEVSGYVSYHHPAGKRFVSLYQVIKTMCDTGYDMQDEAQRDRPRRFGDQCA